MYFRKFIEKFDWSCDRKSRQHFTKLGLMLMTKQTHFNVVNGVDKPPIHDSYDLWHLKKKLRNKKDITLDPRPSTKRLTPFHALFITVPIGLCYNNSKTFWAHDQGAQPVETHVYNCNTSSHLPKLFPFLFLCPPCWIFRRITAVHSFPDSRSRFPVPRSSLPVLVTNIRSKYSGKLVAEER